MLTLAWNWIFFLPMFGLYSPQLDSLRNNPCLIMLSVLLYKSYPTSQWGRSCSNSDLGPERLLEEITHFYFALLFFFNELPKIKVSCQDNCSPVMTASLIFLQIFMDIIWAGLQKKLVEVGRKDLSALLWDAVAFQILTPVNGEVFQSTERCSARAARKALAFHVKA